MNGIEQFAARGLSWAIAESWQVDLLVCLIAILTFLLRGASARLRYGLWLLVLLKIFLPTTLSLPWSVGYWGVTPIAALTKATSDAAAPATDTADGIDQSHLSVEERIADVLSGK